MIGVLDSGIGGVSVLREIIKLIPGGHFIYYSDSLHNPYGDKSSDEVYGFVKKIVTYFLERGVVAIVIACNTASSIASNYLREKYKNIPIIAIEPAYKMVYDYAYDKETLVMATKGTIESEKFNLLYHKYDNHKTKLLECVGLADVIEEGNESKIKNYLERNIGQYKRKIENVVLGCTHYPLIQKEINQVLGGNVRFFNGANRLSVHLKSVLEENELINKADENGKIVFIDSSEKPEKEKRFYKFLKEEDL